MKVLSTSHLGFIVKDLNTIINFYHGILGLKLLSGPSEEFHDVNEGKAMGIVFRIRWTQPFFIQKRMADRIHM